MKDYPVGTVLAVEFFPITHVGIATGNGRVISNSRARGGVCEEWLRAFSEGRPIRVLGHLGSLPGHRVVERARTRIGEPWKLFSSNCEHFVRWAHGVEIESPQLRVAGGLTLFAVVASLIGSAVAEEGSARRRRA